MRQQLVNLTHLLRRQPCQHVFQISIRIVPVEPCRLDRLISAATRLPLRKEPERKRGQIYYQKNKSVPFFPRFSPFFPVSRFFPFFPNGHHRDVRRAIAWCAQHSLQRHLSTWRRAMRRSMDFAYANVMPEPMH